MKRLKPLTLTFVFVLTIFFGVIAQNCDDKEKEGPEGPDGPDVPGDKYTITVTGGTSSKTQAVFRDVITLTAGTQEGKEFSDWTITPSNVTMLSGNSFIMPQSNVTVTGNFSEYDPTAKRPYFITNNYGENSASELLVQWQNASTVTTQTLQIVKATGSFTTPDVEKTATGKLFSHANESPLYIGTFEARNVFKAEAAGLAPNTLYKYRMGTEGAWSKPFYHQTSRGSAANFSFTVVADPQAAVHTNMERTLKAANTYDPDNRFFLMLGDIVNEIGKRPDEIVSYTNTANEFNIERPIIATQGNHDTYRTTPGTDNQYVFGEATVFNAFVTFPDNGWDTDANKANRSQSYYFYYNKVLVVVLNTMSTQSATGTATPVHTAQATWLKNLLEADKAGNLSNYRIVVTHVSPFGGRTSERWLQPEVRAAYGKIFTDYKVDIVFGGHDHVYGRSNPITIGTSTGLSSLNFAGTAGGTVYSIAGATGPKFYTLDPDANRDAYFPYRLQLPDNNSEGFYVNVKVTSGKLTVTAIRADTGAVVDQYDVQIKN
ncbi:MAG: metallophosphoesterase [Treponema sp.]|nr:metallophosphoesterase [Treponema sp.]